MRAPLRALVVVVVVTVALLPVPVVLSLGALGEAREAAAAEATRAAVATALGRLARGDAPVVAARAAADAHRVWLRVFARDGAPVADADRDPRVATYGPVSSLGSGGGDARTDFERAAGPPPRRPTARGGRATGCVSRDGGALLVCESAAATGAGALVHAQRTAASGAQRLVTARQALAALTAFVLVTGVGLAAWLVARVVGPLDALRAELARRAASPRLATRPVTVDAPSEVTEVADAHNRVLAALDDERRAKEALAADLVHEIKSPLAAIRLSLEALDPAGGPARRDAEAAVARIDRTVAMLLEVSRAEAGLPDEARARVGLRALAANVCATFADAPGVTVGVEGDDPEVAVAAEALGRAIGCLVDNARSFARAEVRVRVGVDGRDAVLSVCDDGEGIAPALLPRVFERFFSGRRERGGTGVGLALVRAVAEAHGGSVRAESVVGEGATLTLRVPRS